MSSSLSVYDILIWRRKKNGEKKIDEEEEGGERMKSRSWKMKKEEGEGKEEEWEGEDEEDEVEWEEWGGRGDNDRIRRKIRMRIEKPFLYKLFHKEPLKCPYYGFLKITFHAVCNTALSEWKHPAKF